MPAIGIIDDRRKEREILSQRVSFNLPENWEIIDSDPLEHLFDYASWISAHKVCALILDERLNEQSSDSKVHVDYFGHDLVDFLRKYLPTLPIFIVTSYKTDPSLRERFKDVEDIIRRRDFLKSANEYVPRIARSSQQYLETFQSELAELSDVASKIAAGEATEDEKKRAKAIQGKIESAFSIPEITDRSDWITSMEETIKEFENLKDEIEHHLKKRKHDEVEKDT